MHYATMTIHMEEMTWASSTLLSFDFSMCTQPSLRAHRTRVLRFQTPMVWQIADTCFREVYR